MARMPNATIHVIWDTCGPGGRDKPQDAKMERLLKSLRADGFDDVDEESLKLTKGFAPCRVCGRDKEATIRFVAASKGARYVRFVCADRVACHARVARRSARQALTRTVARNKLLAAVTLGLELNIREGG